MLTQFQKFNKSSIIFTKYLHRIYQHSPKIMFRCFGQKGNLELVKVVGLANCCNLMPVFLMLHHQKSTKKLPLSPNGGPVFRVYTSKILTVILPHILARTGKKQKRTWHFLVRSASGEWGFVLFLICAGTWKPGLQGYKWNEC